MQLKKALDLIFLGFTAKEQVPVRKCSVMEDYLKVPY
jgi:hypothetical protein